MGAAQEPMPEVTDEEDQELDDADVDEDGDGHHPHHHHDGGDHSVFSDDESSSEGDDHDNNVSLPHYSSQTSNRSHMLRPTTSLGCEFRSTLCSTSLQEYQEH